MQSRLIILKLDNSIIQIIEISDIIHEYIIQGKNRS